MRAIVALIAMLVLAPSWVKAEDAHFVGVGETTKPPIGWVELCVTLPGECHVSGRIPGEVILDKETLSVLSQVNRWVNENIKPMTDLEHWGVMEKWSYPDDGYGDCEDYALLKRRMLMEAGFPRGALLITVVHEHNGNGHAVLTVKTNQGEYILDNQNDKIVLWSEAGTTIEVEEKKVLRRYHFVKRQSQVHPNVWVSLVDPRTVTGSVSKK